MQVKDGIDGNFLFNTERFRLDYLQDLKKEANQRAQAQAAIVSLLLPTVLLLYDHLQKRDLVDGPNRAALVVALVLLLLSLAIALVVLVPIPTSPNSKFSQREVVVTNLAAPLESGGWDLDVQAIREEAQSIAGLLSRRDAMLRLSAVLLGAAILVSSATLIRFLI